MGDGAGAYACVRERLGDLEIEFRRGNGYALNTTAIYNRRTTSDALRLVSDV